MIPEIALRREEVRALRRRFGVRRLDLFGSAARDDFDPVDRSRSPRSSIRPRSVRPGSAGQWRSASSTSARAAHLRSGRFSPRDRRPNLPDVRPRPGRRRARAPRPTRQAGRRDAPDDARRSGGMRAAGAPVDAIVDRVAALEPSAATILCAVEGVDDGECALAHA